MAKKPKGKLLWTITMVVLTAGQVGILATAMSFVERVEEAELTYLKQQARNTPGSEWVIDQEELKKNEKIINKQFISNSGRTHYGFYHSEDFNLILSVESPALKRLLNEKYLVVTESKAGDHYVLTLYYNPLKQPLSDLDEMIKVHEVIRFEKPETYQAYELEKQLREEAALMEEMEDDQTLDDSTESETPDETESSEQAKSKTNKKDNTSFNQAEQLQACLNVKDFEPPYPIQDDSGILYETEQFLVYENRKVDLSHETTNINFYDSYLTDTSVFGQYIWDEAIFFDSAIQNPSAPTDEMNK